MAAKKKGSGGSLTRSQVVTVRLDPRLKFAAELAARKQRRTISSFIEWAVEQAVEQVEVTSGDFNNPGESVADILGSVWSVNDAERLVKLAVQHPQLLTFDEECLWKIICDCGHFWKGGVKPNQPYPISDAIYFSRVRNCWDQLNKIVLEDLSPDILDNLPVDKPAAPNKIKKVDDDLIPF